MRWELSTAVIFSRPNAAFAEMQERITSAFNNNSVTKLIDISKLHIHKTSTLKHKNRSKLN